VHGPAATIISPYTTLVVQLGTVLAVALLLARVVRGYRPATALATAGLGLMCVLLVPMLWDAAANNDAIRASLNPGPGVRSREKCFTADGHDAQIAFARWLEARIPADDNVGFQSTSVGAPCLQLALLPRKFVELSANPRWIIVARPLTAAQRRAVQGRIQVYGGNLALVRRG
jgi:hypothetical protein